MPDVSLEMGALYTSAQIKWVKVYAPILFLNEQQDALVPLMREYQTKVVSVMLENRTILEALKKTTGDINKFFEEHIEKTAVSNVDQLNEANFDSALVFGHSILDDTLNQCLRLGYQVWPDFYADKIAQRKVVWGELLKHGMDGARNQAVYAWLDGVERESIRQKFELLLALTKPKDAKAIVKDFNFELSKVEEIDRLRHDIVHNTKSRKVTMGDLEYFSKSTSFATSAMVFAGAPMSIQGLVNGLGVEHNVEEDFVFKGPVTK